MKATVRRSAKQLDSTRNLDDVCNRTHTILYWNEMGKPMKISLNALQSDPRVSAFLRNINRQVGRPRPVMVIVAGEGDFLWIKNFMCNVIEYDMLTRISVVTIDRVTTTSIAKEMPMMPLFELSFAQFGEQMEQLYADAVKERLLGILKLRIGALVLKNKLDALIGVPNQLWTNYFLNRTMYPPVFDLDEESLLVQKLDPLDKESTMIDSASFIGLGRFNPRGARILTRSADLASKKFTTVSSALTYACDVPKRNICRRLSAKRMIGPSWFRSKRDLLPDVVHLPKNAERAALRREGLWLLSKEGKCNDVARRKLNSSLLHSMANWKEHYKTRNAEFRFRFRPPHPMGHRSFLEESAAKDL
ncbi:unnamed protein product [Cylicocyclus nassatus]|uniref:Uncharacterized protein n=1 Tax=Cylicocyclus nassatus TaxID=53992 RepID=A0AA36DUY0_CYLNA|nr:unnamed protein product [Cylicocyclus nassatus]